MTETITVQPNFNTKKIQAYADQHQCRDPQSHIAARLEVLSELDDLIEDEEFNVDHLARAIKDLHAKTTQEFLGFFGGPAASEPKDAPEFRSGPSDEVLIALAKVEYGSLDDIEIDPDAKVSRGEDPGAFVAAWVWVDFPKE
jgi:hypothetical protein